MNSMSIAGRRGEVLWKKGSFLTGQGLARNYDTFVVGLGFVVPLVLRDLVHVWDFPLTPVGECKAILLQPDPAFKRRVFVCNWFGAVAVALVLLSPLAFAKVHILLGVLSIVAAVACIIVAIVCSRQPSRLRDIRLVLGPHTWGSSDPATWNERICMDVVAPRGTFNLESFAEMARKAIDERKWGTAMWAARLSVAVEDVTTGECLTNDILHCAEVSDRLRRIRNRPEQRDREFGAPLPLEQWIKCDPQEHIFGIG